MAARRHRSADGGCDRFLRPDIVHRTGNATHSATDDTHRQPLGAYAGHDACRRHRGLGMQLSLRDAA